LLPQSRLTIEDKLIIAWVISSIIVYTVLYGAIGAFIYKVGFAIIAIGCFFLFRAQMRNRNSILLMLKVLAAFAMASGALMLFEMRTGANLLACVGAIATDEIRKGRIRAQGPFSHSIIAGTVGAILLPLFLGSLSTKSLRRHAVGGIVGCGAIIVASASSTPLAGCAGGILAFLAWPLRRHMRMIRWGIVASIVALQLTMKAPVWALISRMDIIGGSSGWHRFMLVNEFIQHFGDWWLVGTTQNSSWGHDMWDRANWYVLSGYTGGVWTFLLFVAIIIAAFRSVGIARRSYSGDLAAEKLVWAMGSSLFAASICFIGIYLEEDQSIVIWLALLALIAAARDGALRDNDHKSKYAPNRPAPSSFRRHNTSLYSTR